MKYLVTINTQARTFVYRNVTKIDITQDTIDLYPLRDIKRRHLAKNVKNISIEVQSYFS